MGDRADWEEPTAKQIREAAAISDYFERVLRAEHEGIEDHEHHEHRANIENRRLLAGAARILGEYAAEAQTREEEKAKRDRDAVQVRAAICRDLANTIPIPGWHAQYRDDKSKLDDGTVVAPWKCIHSVNVEWYCDDCPVRDHCPQEKNWSK